MLLVGGNVDHPGSEMGDDWGDDVIAGGVSEQLGQGEGDDIMT